MAQFDFDPDFYAQGLTAQPVSTNRGLVVPAIETGFNAAASELGAGIRGVGELLGSKGITDFGQRAEASSQAAAQASANPAYEGSPLGQGFGHALGWAAYQALRGLPQFATIAAGAAAAPEVAGARILGGALAASPFSFGQAYQATQDENGQGNAVKAALMTPALAALSSWMPGHVEGLLERGVEGGLLKRVATHGLVTGAVQMPIAGVTTAITDAANPNLTPQDRINNIIDSAVGGGLVGGLIGGAAAGVGGLRGVRRTNANDISTEDLGTVVSNILQLPKPDQPGGPQMSSGPAMFTDAAGRTADDAGALVATPRDTGMSPTDRMVADATIPQAPPAIDSTTVVADKQGSLRWAKPYEQDDTSRPFRNSTDEELAMAQRVLDAKAQNGPLSNQHQQIADLVQRELEHRTANQSLTAVDAQQGAGAVERTGDGKSGVADQVSAAPAPANDFAARLDELKKGANTAWGRQVDAKDEVELATKVAERLDSHPSNALTEFAVRIGLIDGEDPKKVTPLAAAVEQAKAGSKDEASLASAKEETTTEPAAPANAEGGDRSVDAEFQQQWAQELSKKQGLALQDLRDNPPANAEDAQQRIYDALGKNTPGEDTAAKDGYNALVDLAKKHGILDDEGRYTDVGLDIAKSRVSMQDAVEEAQNRGLSGAETSAFDRGARGQPQTKFDSIGELKAFHDGQRWGEDQRNGADLHPGATDEQTREIQGSLRDTRPTEDAIQQQFLNQAVDQTYGSTVKPQELAQLKRMVRDGASGKEIDEAARYFKSGHGALVQEQPAARSFRGEVIDRTPGLMRMLAKRKEARDAAARQELEGKLNSNPMDVRGAERIRTDRQLIQERLNREAHINDLRDALKSAHDNGEITRLDLIRGIARLKYGDIHTVEGMLSGGVLRNRQNGFVNDVTDSAATIANPRRSVAPELGKPLQGELLQKVVLSDPIGALKYLRDNSNARNSLQRTLAGKLLRGIDWSRVSIIRQGDQQGWHGETHLLPDGSSEIHLSSTGLNEETFLHEALHAWLQQKIGAIDIYTDANRRLLHDAGTRALDDPVRHVQELWQNVRSALEKTNPDLLHNEHWAREAFVDPDEFLAWSMTNRRAQDFMRSVDINGNKIVDKAPSLWDKVRGFVADLLGLPQNAKTLSMLDRVMDAGLAVLDAGAETPTDNFSGDLARSIGQRGLGAHERVSAQAYSDATQSAVKLVQQRAAPKIEEHIDDWKDKALSAGIDTMPYLHLDEHYGKVVPELKEMTKLQGERNATSAVLAKIIHEPMDAYERLARTERNKPVFTKMINDIAAATAYGVDPTHPWKAQTWLHSDPQAALLKDYADNAYRQYQALRAAGHAHIYDGLRQSLEADGLMRMSNNLHSLVTWDPALANEVKNFGGDRMAAFRDMTDKHNPAAAAEHWKAALAAQMAAVDNYVRQLRGDPTLVREQRDAIEKRLSPIEAYIGEVRNNLASMAQAPYFHLYREGNDFVAAKLKTLEDGRADPDAATAVAAALGKAGFDDVHITAELANPSVYMRVENGAQRRALERAMVELRNQGHIQQDSILAGPKAREGLVSEGTRKIIEHMMSSIESHPMFATEGKTPDEVTAIENQKKVLKDVVREQWLNELPFNSVNRVLAHRESVQGFSKNMVRGTFARYAIGAQALARQWARPYANDILTRAGARTRAAMSVEDPQHGDVDTINTLYSAMLKRDFQQAQTDSHGVLDMIRQMTNVFYLGFSPSYGLVQLTQLGALTLPKLGAKHGFGKAFSAMSRATPLAFRLLRQAVEQGSKVSSARAMDAAITDNVLKKAVPDASTREFLAHMIASGTIDIGSFTRALTLEGGLDPNERMGRLMRYASSIGLYSETFTRLVAALAARELHGGKMSMPVEDYAKSTINNSLFQYQSWNTAPLISRHGPAGQLGPMIAQFQNYNVQLGWTLYRELHKAFIDKAATAAERGEARRFLGGHLVAMTALAGTLGMPFAAAGAGIIDKIKDELWPGDQPFDVNSEYRNFLADMFGKEVGEIVARGVPRALDFDLSQRIGEQNLLPFTGLLTSQRKWGDTIEQWGPQAVGAPFSMISSVLRGTDQLKDGDVMGGMATMMPSALRGPFKTYQMSQKGYVDANGNTLPIASPRATDYLVQLVGLNPEVRAEYSEARGAQADRKAALTRTSNALKQQIVRALSDGDRSAARDLIAQAQRFDKANPTYAVLPRIESDMVHSSKVQGISDVTETPIGVNPKDLNARGLTSYANIDYQAQ